MAEDEFTTLSTDAAVFLRKKKRAGNCIVELSPTHVRAFARRKTGREIHKGPMIDEWEIVEVAKAGEAWDVRLRDMIARLVVQTGCGCGGMRRYAPDASYSGRLPLNGPLWTKVDEAAQSS